MKLKGQVRWGIAVAGNHHRSLWLRQIGAAANQRSRIETDSQSGEEFLAAVAGHGPLHRSWLDQALEHFKQPGC